MIKILIADDHQMFREGISSVLNSIEQFEVVQQASNGKEALNLAREHDVDVILMDVNMPELNGVEATEAILKEGIDAKILMLTMHNDFNTIEQVMKSGAHGYLLKHASKKELIEGIEAVNKNGTYFVEEVKEVLFQSFRSDNTTTDIKLTPRERDILQLICEEFTTQQIADKLYISTHTVESHRKNLLAKTGVKSSVGLVKFALENELLSPL